MNPTIEIVVSPTGQTQVQTRGFAGSGCREATRALEQALGPRLSEQLTPEFHQPASQSLQLPEQQHLQP